MKTKLREIDIEEGLEHFFRGDKAGEGRGISRQVYFGGKKIDIIIDNEGSLIAIEVKIKDWRTALRQANLNKIACSHSYVAMWHEYAFSAIDNIDQFIKNEVGLIIVDSDNKPFPLYSPHKNNRFLRGCSLKLASGVSTG